MRYFTLRYFAFLYISLWSAIALAQTISVTDYHNKQLVLEKPANRIISLGPHITENIYSAGAGDLIVGVIAYSDFPEQAKQHPVVGSAQGLSIEKIVSLSPDLIIAWSSGISQKALSALGQFGIPIYHDEPKTLDDIAKSIRDIGRLTGRSAISEQRVNQYLSKVQGLREQYAHRKPVSVFYPIWNDPLMTLNGQHIVSDVIRLCGGRNSFADAVVIAPTISIESVLKRNPDTIIASGAADGFDRFNAWRKWPELAAVKNEHLLLMPPDILQRHSERLLQAAEILCQHLENVRAN